MRKTILFLIILGMFAPLTFAGHITVKKDLGIVLYKSKKDITDFKTEQAKIILALEEKYPGEKKYEVSWEKRADLTGKIIHIPGFTRLYCQTLYDNGKIMMQEIYIGRVGERLKRVASEKSEEFDFDNDEFSREENTAYLIAPGFEK